MVATPQEMSGSVMMVVGALMVILAVITILIKSDALPMPMPMPIVILGLVFVAVGPRQRRTTT